MLIYSIFLVPITIQISQIGVINVVHWSIILVLHLSAAHGDLHELSSLVVLALMVMWPLGSCLVELAKLILSLLGNNVRSTDFLCNFSKVSVLVHGGLCDRDHCLHNIPKDTLHERSGGQRPGVGESSVEVDELNELAEVERAVSRVVSVIDLHLLVLLLVDQGSEELVVPEDVWILDFS